jgi:hypothetical protein
MTMLCGTGLVLVISLLAILVVLPLYSLLSKSLEDMDGNFVGLQNFHEYFQTPSLLNSITNSFKRCFFFSNNCADAGFYLCLCTY